MCEKFKEENGYDVPLPMFVYDFFFKHYDSPMDEHDPTDVVDGLIYGGGTIGSYVSDLPVDINIFDYRYSGFVRYPTPMVAVDGMKGSRFWNHLVPVSISEFPEILIPDELLQKRSDLTHDEWITVLEFISKNHEPLLKLWNCQSDEEDWDLSFAKIKVIIGKRVDENNINIGKT